jgi:16S rRNA (guanine966-N2)-methyltransferase
MRIIAGQFRRRPLRSLRGLDLRPTSDRLRETLFDILTGREPSALEGSVWIDLFAGTGAVGIEALSRGAAMVYFVESSKRAAELIDQNLKPFGIASRFEILKRDSQKAMRDLQARQVTPNFIFLDPPYRLQQAYQDTLIFLGNSHLSRRALVIAEHEKRSDPGGTFVTLERFRTLQQGDAALSFYRNRE